MSKQPLTIVRVPLAEHNYPIYIGHHIFGNTEPLTQHVRGKQVAIISDTNVAPLFQPPLKKALEGYTLLNVVLATGEEYKTLDTAEIIYRQLLENNFNRDATLIAVGGGVIGDLCGFVAATYQRGIPFIQMPTTLLAQVDASVGGKTAVNHALGKNMIGAFYQPQCVITDIAALASLPGREYISGIAEIIKYGLIMDKNFFVYLEEHAQALYERDADVLHYVIKTSCQCKASIVAQDAMEHGRRAILNFGHSFAHAIETAQEYKGLLHGESVSVGMRLATQLSEQLGYTDARTTERVINILRATGLPLNIPEGIDLQQLGTIIKQDKKVASGQLRLVLLKSLGKAVLEQAPSTKDLDSFLRNNAVI